MNCEIARVSSKGQIVIPGGIRKKMGLEKGSKLLLLMDGPNLLMRIMTPPELGVFASLISKSFEMIKKGSKEYAALWSAIQRHNISDVIRHV